MGIDRTVLQDILRTLENTAELPAVFRCCVGFDGFVDNIYRVVKQRKSPDDYIAFDTIGEFGERIARSAGKSSDTEIVLMETRAGGNAPNMAMSLASLGFPTTCIGLLGEPEPCSPFNALFKTCDCISVGGAAVTQAFEFRDGKLMFGCMNGAGAVDWSGIKSRAGIPRIAQAMGGSSLICVVNWSYLYNICGIVRGITDELDTQLPPEMLREKTLFFDLADISTRSRADIREMADAAGYASGSGMRTVLGLNENEAHALAGALGLPAGGSLPALTAVLAECVPVETVMVHSNRGSCAARNGEAAEVPGFHIEVPLISTGGGDNFNGGFCMGLLLGFPLEQCLWLGSAAASFYISHARCGTRPELMDFIRSNL